MWLEDWIHDGESMFDKDGSVCICWDLIAIWGSLVFSEFYTDMTEDLVKYMCINWIQNTMKLYKQNQT